MRDNRPSCECCASEARKDTPEQAYMIALGFCLHSIQSSGGITIQLCERHGYILQEVCSKLNGSSEPEPVARRATEN